jgi:hypothetical protein
LIRSELEAESAGKLQHRPKFPQSGARITLPKASIELEVAGGQYGSVVAVSMVAARMRVASGMRIAVRHLRKR